jgi:diacylglycerol kinase (ATP)
MTRVSFIDSALCATRGLFKGISSERSLKIQLLISIVIIAISVAFDISKVYLITLVIVCFLVIILELFNRGFEKLIDLISPEYNKEFGKVKDAMAGVVLLTFGMAVIVSFLILYEPLINILKILPKNPVLIILIAGNILLIPSLILIEHRKRNNHRSIKT